MFHIFLLGLQVLFCHCPSFQLGSLFFVCQRCVMTQQAEDLGHHSDLQGDGSHNRRVITHRWHTKNSDPNWNEGHWQNDLHLHLVIRQGSPLFWRISSAVGIRLWGHCGLSTCWWQPFFCALGASRRLICSHRVSPQRFPHSVPSSRITGWSSWMRFAFIGPPWVCTLSFLPFVGWGMVRVGETILSGVLASLLTEVGVVRSPSPPLLNYMKVLPHRSLVALHLGFVVPAFWPWFSPWPFARTYLPFSDS